MKTSLFSRGFGIFILLNFLIISPLSAQVGIGTTNPNSNALLDIDASTTAGGLLLPRVALTALNSPLPLSANVAGMTVYNTVTAGTSPNIVTPGYYYNDGGAWVRIAAANNWGLAGNVGTVPGTNFIGTSDDVPVRIRSNTFDRFEITSGTVADGGRMHAFADGTALLPLYSWNSDPDIGMYRIAANTLGFSGLQVSVNGAPLLTGDRFTVIGANNEYAINGYSLGVNGAGVYGENSSNGIGVWGNVGNGIGVRGTSVTNGRGVQGENSGTGFGMIGFSDSSGFGVQGQNTGNGIGVVGIVPNQNAVGVWAENQNTNGVGLIALSGGTYRSLAGSGGTLSGVFGAAGASTSPTGTGIVGIGNNGLSVYTLANGSGVSGTGNTTGIYGISTNNTLTRQGGYFTMNKAGLVLPAATDDPIAILAGYNGTDYFGGYFDGNQDNTPGGPPQPNPNGGEDYAYVGIRTGGTTYKVVGTGSNSTLVNDAQGNKRVLFSPEAPEILFEDYGTGQLTNGQAIIQIDPLLSSVIHVSNDHPLKVFIQLEGDCNGVFVTNKSANSFTVNELANGNSNVPFSWHIVANRADTVLSNGTVFSKHVDVRFPIGPNKIKPQEIVANEAIVKTSSSKLAETMEITKKQKAQLSEKSE